MINPETLLEEINALGQNGISVEGRLFLSNRMHLIFPYHSLLEKQLENSPYRRSIGTTARGIGPAYEDKIGRRGIRMSDLEDEANFRCLAKMALQEKQTALRACGSELSLDEDRLVEDHLNLYRRLRPMVVDTAVFLNREMDAGRSVLFEGAQGTMLTWIMEPTRTLLPPTHGGRSLHRVGRCADPDFRNHWGVQGIYHARGGRPVSHRG